MKRLYPLQMGIENPKKAGVYAAYPQPPDNHSTHRIEMAKEEGVHERLPTARPVLSSLEQGLELMRESAPPLVQPHTLHLLAGYVCDGLGCCWLLPAANMAVEIYNL